MEGLCAGLRGRETVRHPVVFAPVFFGYGLNLVWKALSTPFAPSLPWLAFVQVALPLAVVLLWCSGRVTFNLLRFAWIAGWTGAAGTLALGFAASGMAVPVALQAAAALLMAVSSAMALLYWSELYARMGMASASIAIAGSYVLGAVAFFGAVPLSPAVGLGLSVLLPLASSGAFALAMAHGRLEARPSAVIEPRQGGSRFSAIGGGAFPWRVIVVVAVYQCAAGMSRVDSNAAIDLGCCAIAGAVAVAFVLVTLRPSVLFNAYQALRLVFPLMTVSLIVGMMLGHGSLASKLLIGVSQTIAIITLMMLLCDNARRFGTSALLLVAVARTCTQAAFLAGDGVGGAVVAAQAAHLMPFLYGGAAAIIVMATLYWLSGPSRDALLPKGDSLEGAPLHSDDGAASGASMGGEPKASTAAGALAADEATAGHQASQALQSLIEQRCRVLADEYGLSNRESEVLVLLAWGKSARRVEELLVVSPNTVKTHVRHIYAKLGIHSRAELDLLLFGESMRAS